MHEFFSSLHRNPSASALVVQAIKSKCLDAAEFRSAFRTDILKCVENVHVSQIGELLKLLLPKMLECRQSALSRLVSNLASRKIELLLTMPMGEVTGQLPRDELIRVMDSLIESKLVKK